MAKQKNISMLVPVSDCEYVLEGVAQTLRENGIPKIKALKPLTDAAKRLLSVSFMDRNMRVSTTVLEAEARRIAVKLLATA